MADQAKRLPETPKHAIRFPDWRPSPVLEFRKHAIQSKGNEARRGQNRYSPEILMNIFYWLADTRLIDDVEVFHRVKTDFAELRLRMKVMVSLIDFIDKFGASTGRVQDGMMALEKIYAEAAGHYLEHSFADSQVVIASALSRLPALEDLARREKDRALVWVYLIEWFVSASALFISGIVLWALMVRRRLYRAIEMTKLRTADL